MIISKGDLLVETDAGPEFDPGERVEGVAQVAPLSWRWSAPWLGQSWDLTDFGKSPVFKTRGAQGFGPVDPEHWWSDAPTLHGSSWQGFRTGRGEAFLPLVVRGNDSADFLSNHRAFFASLDPSQEGVLQVIAPDGSYRENRLRYQSGANGTPMMLDPVAQCHANYGITWAAADPYWSGPAVERLYEYEATAAFFPGPPFTLGKGLTIGGATVDNPGEVESFAVWRVTGPFTGFTVGVGSAVTSLTLTRAAGQWVEVDTRPGIKTIRDDTGADVFNSATAVDMSATIPPTKGLPLALSVLGASVGSSVRLSFTPRYRGAW